MLVLGNKGCLLEFTLKTTQIIMSSIKKKQILKYKNKP